MEAIQDAVQNAITNSMESIKASISDGIVSFVGTLLKGILIGIIDNSYWICMFICLIAYLCYLCGNKKAAKYSTLSVAIFFILRAIKGVL